MADAAESRRHAERELFMRSLVFVRSGSASARWLAGAMRELSFEAGDEIYREGAPSDQIFFLIEGEIELRHGSAPPWSFGGNSVVGVLDAAMSRPYSRSAIAVKSGRALILQTVEYFSFLQDTFSDLMNVLEVSGRQVLDLGAESGPNDGLERPPGPAPRITLSETGLLPALRVLSVCPAFTPASVQARVRVAAAAELRRLEPGETLWRIGDPTEALAVLACGRLRLERPGRSATVAPGAVVGGFMALGPPERTHDVVAEDASLVLTVPLDMLYDVLEDHHDLVLAWLRYLTEERERVQNARARAREAREARG